MSKDRLTLCGTPSELLPLVSHSLRDLLHKRAAKLPILAEITVTENTDEGLSSRSEPELLRDLFRQIGEHHGLTKNQDVAKLLGVTSSYLSKLTNGHARLTQSMTEHMIRTDNIPEKLAIRLHSLARPWGLRKA